MYLFLQDLNSWRASGRVDFIPIRLKGPLPREWMINSWPQESCPKLFLPLCIDPSSLCVLECPVNFEQHVKYWHQYIFQTFQEAQSQAPGHLVWKYHHLVDLTVSVFKDLTILPIEGICALLNISAAHWLWDWYLRKPEMRGKKGRMYCVSCF